MFNYFHAKKKSSVFYFLMEMKITNWFITAGQSSEPKTVDRIEKQSVKCAGSKDLLFPLYYIL